MPTLLLRVSKHVCSCVNNHSNHLATSIVFPAGPLKGTVGDFWRMVWEYKLFTIIMLTETVEAGRVSCVYCVYCTIQNCTN